MAVEERLADRDARGGGGAGTGPGAVSAPAAELAPDGEADVVAEDRRRGRDGDDGLDRQVPAARDDAGGDQRGLARHRDAHRLDRDEQEDDRQADVLGDVQEGREGRDHHPASSMLAVPALTITARDAGSRARAGRPAHRPRRGPHARLRARWRPRRRSRACCRPRSRRSATTSSSATPSTCSSIPATSASRASAACTSSWAGAGRSSPTPAASRSSRWATAPWPTRSRAARRTAAERQGGILAIEERGVRFRSYLDGSERFMAPETSMEIQAALGLGPRARLRRVHAAQRRRATTPRARPSARTAGCAAAWTGTTSTARTASSSTGSSRAASTRTCASSRRRRSPPASATASRSAARWAPTRPRCTGGRLDDGGAAGGPPAPPARHRRDRRPRARRRAGHRHLRLRDADAARAATAWSLVPDPERRWRVDLTPGALEGLRRAAHGGLPVPGLRARAAPAATCATWPTPAS